MKIAYFDCFAGAGGDMILGALVDAGLSIEALAAELSKLPLSGYRLSAQGAQREALGGTQVIVALDEAVKAPEQRSLGQILDLIAASSLPPRVREQGSAIFSRLAAAEAKVHRIPADAVHFHELGAVDAIVDVMGAVTALNLLGVEQVFASALPSGGGEVDTDHGTLPLPAPATLELLAMAKAPLRPFIDPTAGELVTPTAAAIITTLASFQQPSLILERIGYGVGARELANLPNMLRVWLGETATPKELGLLLLETNIDDMNPELYSYILERLFEHGACDVWLTPIQMKKNRPAVMLSVLAPHEAEGELVETILRETSTLGIRAHPVQRHELERGLVQVDTSLGKVGVKLKHFHDAPVSVAPEYEECRRLALEHGLPLQEVYRIVTLEASVALLGGDK